MAGTEQLRNSVVAALVLVLLLAASDVEAQGLSCSGVQTRLASCAAYVMGKARAPGNSCCSGVSHVNTSADTTKKRQDVCNCLKKTVGSMKGINEQLMEKLPSVCHVKTLYPIRLSTDCSSVK